MAKRKPTIPSARLEVLDRQLVESYRQAWETGAAAAGSFLVCRIGCTDCCVGVFEISGLDAWRLRRGFLDLALREPQLAAKVKRRAQEQWRMLQAHFPGDKTTGALACDEQAREAFFQEFADLPCPALDPLTGCCLLYQARPLSCRSFGLPCRWGAEVLPPCRLNFQGADAHTVAAATVAFDPRDLEGEILQALGNPPDTVIAAALALGRPCGGGVE